MMKEARFEQLNDLSMPTALSSTNSFLFYIYKAYVTIL